MLDTVNIKLWQLNSDANFLEEVPCYLDAGSIRETNYLNTGNTSVSGSLGNLNVLCTNSYLKIGNGSWCKWLLGDNYQTMTRKDVVQAVEKLQDTLHLSLQSADVLRLDAGVTMITKQKPDVYIKHLGELKGFERVATAKSTLYYKNKKGIEYKFYDKNKEQKQKKQEIPELYKNIYRYKMFLCKYDY